MKSTSRKYVLIVILMLACINLSAQITSTFNTTAQGWTTPNDADGTIAYSSTGGNPGGFVFGTPFSFNLGAGTVYVPFHFVAPAAYLGNRSTYYNGTLQYDIQQSSTGTPNQYAEVIIANSLGITLYYFPTVPNQPAVAPTWTTFSVTLNNTLGFWKTTNSPTGSVATEAQVLNVLTGLADLELRGLYRDANTTNRLDNVSFRPPIMITTQPASSTTCAGPTLLLTTAAINNPAITYQWQRETSSKVWSNVTNGGGYGGATTASLSINTTGNFGAGNYRCRISGTGVNDVFTNTAIIVVNPLPTAPTTTGNAACGSSALTLSAAGGAAGQYRWYTVPTDGKEIAAQPNNTYTTPVIASTTTYYVAINNGTCQSTRTPVIATINIVNATITQVDNTLMASAGNSYQWFLFGQPISQATNQTLKISLYEYAVYAVEVTQGNCKALSDDFEYLITAAENFNPELKVYPNPIDEDLSIEFKPPYQLYVVDITGKIVHQVNVKTKSIRIDLSNLSKGIYLLRIQNDDATQSFRILKE